MISSIYIGNIVNFILFYKDEAFIYLLGANFKNDRYPKLKLEEFVEARKYIDEQPDVEMFEADFKKAINNNFIISDALAFLTESVKSQKDLITKFPYGLLTLPNLSLDLSTNKISPHYGNLNNNYLSSTGEIIYSDNLEVLQILSQVIKSLDKSQLEDVDFIKNYILALKNHWITMKNSGDYGEDGLSYGKRGYSKIILMSLSNLNPEKASFKNDLLLPSIKNNFSTTKSPLIGFDLRISEERVFQLAEEQSYIIQGDKDVAMISGSLALLMSHFSKKLGSSKHEMVDFLIKIVNKNVKEKKSIILDAIFLGKNLHNLSIDPIMVYNKIPGFIFDQFLTLVVYSFLEFDNFAQAMKYILHTPGDNESLLALLSFLYGIYDKKAMPDYMLNFLEGKNIKLLE